MSHTRKGPNLAPTPGLWINPDFLPGTLRAEMLLHLHKSPLTEDQQAGLIRFCNDLAQLPADDTPMATQADELEKVAANARRLLASLAGLSPGARDALAMHAHDLNLRGDDEQGDSFTANAWEMVHALEVAAGHTLSQLEFDRQAKPAQQRGRGLVIAMAGYLIRTTGKAPPKDRAAWFAAFVECFGQHMGLEIGPRIVAAGIEAATR